MIIVVTGSRNYSNQSAVWEALDRVHGEFGIEILLTGKCPKGADQFAENWAIDTGVQLVLIPANWRGLDKSNNAGKVRNGLMLDIALKIAAPRKPRLLAFASCCISPNCRSPFRKHISHGTQDCWDKAVKLGLRAKYFTDETLI